METKVEALQDNEVRLTVTIEASEVDSRIKKTYKDFAYKYNFPGFRRGKAPRPVIDNALGAQAVVATVTDELVNGQYPLAVDAAGLYPIGKPVFEDSDELIARAGEDFTFSAVIACKPDYELSSYEPVEIELPSEGASDEEVDDQIEMFREHYFDFKDCAATAKIAKDGFADLKIVATDPEGNDITSLSTESRMYGLGVDLFPEAFDEQLIGLKKGQTASFDLDISNTSSMMTSPLASKFSTVHFEIEVLRVKKKILPELTDEWVKETLGFDSVADMRERVAETIVNQKANVLPGIKESACLTVLAARLQGEAPEIMTEAAEAELLQSFFAQLQSQGASFDAYLMQQGLTPEQFKADIKLQAADVVKQDLALDAWARHAEYVVTEEEMSAEFVKSGAEDPAALEEEWRENGQMHMLRQGIMRTRAVEEIMNSAVVTELKPEPKTKAKKSSKKKVAAETKEAPAAEEAPVTEA